MPKANDSEKEAVSSIVKRLRGAIENNKERIDNELRNHENKIYGAIILKFHFHISELESAIRYHLSQDELYTAKVLLRTLIEHLATAQYIWCREHLLHDENLTPELYFIAYRASENIKRFGFNNKVKRIIDENIEKDTVKAYSLEKGQEAAVSQRILTVASQFDLHNMVTFLVKTEALNQILGGFNEIFIDALKDYNFLSSYVHGGPSALFWDEDEDVYNAEKISSDLDVFVGTMMKILLWTYTRSSNDNSVEKQSQEN